VRSQLQSDRDGVVCAKRVMSFSCWPWSLGLAAIVIEGQDQTFSAHNCNRIFDGVVCSKNFMSFSCWPSGLAVIVREGQEQIVQLL